MFLFNGLSSLLYLTRKSLKFYNKEGELGALEFPPSIISNEEIIDEEKFEEAVIEFLAKTGAKKNMRFVLALSREVLFLKSIKITTPDKVENQTKRFLDKIPFEPGQIAKLEFTTEQEKVMVATNKALYTAIADIVGKIGAEVLYVAPLTAFEGMGEEVSLSPDEVKAVLGNSRVLKENNFLAIPDALPATPQESSGEEEEDTEKASGKIVSYVIGFLGVVALASAVTTALVTLGFVPNPIARFLQKPQAVSVMPTPKPIISPESTASAKPVEATGSPKISDKKNVTVEILNGSGLAGQASRVRDFLIKLGFEKFELGNVPKVTGETTAVFADNLSQPLQNDVTEELKRLFGKVATKSATQSAKFDISITTRGALDVSQ